MATRPPGVHSRHGILTIVLSVRRIVITPQVCATLDVLLRAETSDPKGIDINEICVRCPMTRNTIYPILSKLVSARWVNRRPETPQSQKKRAGPGKGGPPHMRTPSPARGTAPRYTRLTERAPAPGS